MHLLENRLICVPLTSTVTNAITIRVQLLWPWSKWQPSARSLCGYVNMSLIRICAFSKCLYRRSLFQKCIPPVTHVDYCRLCFAVRNGPVRHISGEISPNVTTLVFNHQQTMCVTV